MAGAPNHDPEILELFQAELDAHLPVLSDGLLMMEKGPVDGRQIEAMMRAAHSIKGAARIVGIEPVVRVAHVMEDCFSAAKSGKIVLTSESVDALLRGVDALEQSGSPAGGNSGDAPPLEEILDGIAAVRDGRPAVAKQAAPATVPGAAAIAARRDSPPEELLLPPVLDGAAARRLRQECIAILDRAPAGIRLDFSQVRQLTVAGVSLLVAFIREAAGASPPPAITFQGAGLPIERLWRVLGIDAANHAGG